MKPVLALTLALSGAAMIAPAASAQVESVRLGVMKHNICVTDCKNADKESGVNISGEVRFDSPGFLGFVWSPTPEVMASVKTDGNTSSGGVGLSWDINLSDTFRLEPGVGYVLHDGEVNNPYPAGTQAAVDFSEDHVLLGSEDL